MASHLLFFFASYRAHRDLPSFPTRRSSDLRGRRDDLVEDGLVRKDRRIECRELPDPRERALDVRTLDDGAVTRGEDRKSTRLNSSHTVISYAVFCLKKKNNRPTKT